MYEIITLQKCFKRFQLQLISCMYVFFAYRVVVLSDKKRHFRTAVR